MHAPVVAVKTGLFDPGWRGVTPDVTGKAATGVQGTQRTAAPVNPFTARRTLPLSSDAIGDQRRPHALARYFTYDCDQLLTVAKRGLAAGHLHVGMRAIVVEVQIDAPEQFLERNILHRLGMLRQVAGGAVEIAALGDLERDAADRPASPMS